MPIINTEFFDDPIKVICSIDEQGQINLKNLTWKERPYTIVAVGRQWDEDDGRHVMAEAGDRTRFELLLRRTDLTWRVRKVWRAQMFA
ncbi:MAG: hypothetical protein JW953_03290 [Anaerolineae bacterium]|nr:hypothetical protein [Anaerolineae bacterium]